MLETLRDDLRFAARMLRKSPVFTLVAVLVVALGTGAVTTIYSAMNALLFRPLPGAADPTRLVDIGRTLANGEGSLSASNAYYEYVRDNARSLGGVAAWSKASYSIATEQGGTAVYGNIVSGNFFSVLGARPALGRFFLPEEDGTPLAHPVIVVSHSFWESRLGADSGAVGRAVLVNGRPYTLVGVAAPEFRGIFTPLKTDAWVPLAMQAHIRPGRDLDDARWLQMFARLGDDVTREAVQAELTALAAARATDPAEPADTRIFSGVRTDPMTGLPADAHATFLGFSGLLLGAAALVLLIASVDVASMLSARAVARQREMAVRAALGAGRGRLVRQLLTESLLLFALGAGGGFLVALTTTRALERWPIPADIDIVLELSPDLRVLVFALGVALLTGVLFGVGPALQTARRDITSRLRDGAAASGTRRRLASNVLVVGQLALSLVLLVGAGLFLRALDRGARIDPGFDMAGVATMPLNAESWGYGRARAQGFSHDLRGELEAIPGVTDVAFSHLVPLTFSSSGDEIELDAPGTGDESNEIPIQRQNVDPGYFDVVRIPLVAGRDFGTTDVEGAPRVAIVNETLARRIAPDGSALGRTFRLGGERTTIVGVARDAKYSSLGERTPSFAYFPLAQWWQPNQAVLVRTAGDPASLAPAIRSAVRRLDPALPPPAVSTMDEMTAIVLLPQRVAALVTGVLGAIGLLLAAVGLYGMIAFSTSRRTREIGIRVALGARAEDVLRMIVGEGMRLAALGVAIGIVLAAAATRLLASLLFDISPLDPITFVFMTALFALIALVASWLPARRAAGADPMTALRSD